MTGVYPEDQAVRLEAAYPNQNLVMISRRERFKPVNRLRANVLAAELYDGRQLAVTKDPLLGLFRKLKEQTYFWQMIQAVSATQSAAASP